MPLFNAKSTQQFAGTIPATAMRNIARFKEKFWPRALLRREIGYPVALETKVVFPGSSQTSNYASEIWRYNFPVAVYEPSGSGSNLAPSEAASPKLQSM